MSNNSDKRDQNSLKRVAGNSAWMIISKVLNIALGLFVTGYVTRYLGPEQKGAMADAAAISGFFGFLASFGLLDILISKFSEERLKSGKIAATGMVIMLVGGLAAFILSMVSAVILATSVEVLIYVAVDAFVYFFQGFTVYEFWFYSNANSKYYAVAQFVIHLLFMIIRLVGVPLKAHLAFFVVAAAAEVIAVYLVAYVCYKISKCPFEGWFAFDKQLATELIKLAAPMVMLGFATTIYMKVDQIMVGKMMGNWELGIYSGAVVLAEYWYFVPTTIYSSFLPIITRRYKEGRGFEKTLQQFTDLMVFIGYAAAIVVMIFGGLAVRLLYGADFSASTDVLIVYIWSGLFTCLSLSGQAYYIIHKDTKTVMWINVFGAMMNLVLNLCLIKLLGGIGAAVATLLEYMIVAFGQMIILRKRYSELYKIQLKAFFPFVRLIEYAKEYYRGKGTGRE